MSQPATKREAPGPQAGHGRPAAPGAEPRRRHSPRWQTHPRSQSATETAGAAGPVPAPAAAALIHCGQSLAGGTSLEEQAAPGARPRARGQGCARGGPRPLPGQPKPTPLGGGAEERTLPRKHGRTAAAASGPPGFVSFNLLRAILLLLLAIIRVFCTGAAVLKIV